MQHETASLAKFAILLRSTMEKPLNLQHVIDVQYVRPFSQILKAHFVERCLNSNLV